MPINVNSTASLLGAYGVIDRPNPVLLNLFFQQTRIFETAEVYFDRVQRARRLAPLVVPTVEGKPMPSRGYTTLGFQPPYVKPKHAIEPTRFITRRAGENLLGSLSIQERFELALLDNLQLEDWDITRREEWMAAQLMQTGKMTCQSDSHPAVIVDLQRNPAHTVQLTGALAWGQTGVDPLGNLQDWAAMVQANSGFNPDMVIMDPKAGRAFTRAPGVLQVMNSFRQTVGNINLAGVVTGGAPGQELKLLGEISGFTIWQYQNLYMDDTGVLQKFMPDNTVIMANQYGFSGVRCYGAVLDAGALRPLDRFPKVWEMDDPSTWFSMTQSAPLPLAGWVDASFCATVA